MRSRIWVMCVVALVTSFTCEARADLLGYWSANSPNEDFALKNDQGNADLDGEIFGAAAYTEDAGGVTGLAGDFALDFSGDVADYAALPASEGVAFDEITLTAWMKGAPTGDWSGIFYSRGAPALGLGYGGGTGHLTYTWNDNSADTWDWGGSQTELSIPQDEWTFVAMTVEADNATLYVGAKDGELLSVTNEIPHLAQTPTAEWRLGQDDCCGGTRNFMGQIDDASIWDHRLTAEQIVELHSGTKLPNDPSLSERVGGLRQVQVAGVQLGSEALVGELSNVVVGEAIETSGLSQYWFEGNLRGNVEFFLESGEEGTEANPRVAAPFASETTWWAGPQNQDIISDQALPSYPEGLAGTRFENSAGEDDYAVRLTGEIFIAEDGEYLVRDGIDDFTMIAIDQDGNGELDDLDSLSSDDVGTLFPGDPIGDVLVLDDDWSNIDGSSQQEDYHGIADIQNIPADGEWRQIEIWMSEGGGGDAGIVYMGNLDDNDVFDETFGDALSQEEIDTFVIRNDQLRTVVSTVESADASASLRTNVDYVVQASAEGNDQFSIDNNDGTYATTLDVSGATITVQTEGELEDGTVFKLFDADNVVGLDSLTLTFEDPSQWDLRNLATGEIAFFAGGFCDPNTNGDLDGNGKVDFADFLVMSTYFGQDVADHTMGDIDCNGRVEFADFLITSTFFGQDVGDAANVPEPSTNVLLLLVIAVGLLARRSR